MKLLTVIHKHDKRCFGSATATGFPEHCAATLGQDSSACSREHWNFAAGKSLNPNESAIYATLPAGNYTDVVRGTGDTTGTALVEVYSINQ